MKNLVNYLDDLYDSDNSMSESICSRMKNKHDDNHAALKAYKKQSREEEIQKYGKPINHHNVFRDRSKYSRKDKHKHTY